MFHTCKIINTSKTKDIVQISSNLRWVVGFQIRTFKPLTRPNYDHDLAQITPKNISSITKDASRNR